MNYTKYKFNDKKLASLSLGCMRFPSREAALEVIAECVKNDIVYLDTSPSYCYKSEEENCETWVGSGIKGIRDKVILSAKSTTGNGGMEVGEYNPVQGKSITTADQVRRQIDQSLRRLNVDKLDFYQLWAIHSPNLFDEALKPGGWMEGVLKAKDEGLFNHIGITGHSDANEIKRWVDSGYFEMITVPFNIMNTSRVQGINYANEKDIPVLAMNPLSGGLLGSPSAAIVHEMSDLGVTSAFDMALRYCTSFQGVSALCGMTSKDQVKANIQTINKAPWTKDTAEIVGQRFNNMLGKVDNVCTQCGYCMPCTQNLNIPEILKLRNYYLILQLESAKNDFQKRYINSDAFKADKCIKCGSCESKCPNSLPIIKLLENVMDVLGS